MYPGADGFIGDNFSDLLDFRLDSLLLPTSHPFGSYPEPTVIQPIGRLGPKGQFDTTGTKVGLEFGPWFILFPSKRAAFPSKSQMPIHVYSRP